jgi:hypothetical protein
MSDLKKIIDEIHEGITQEQWDSIPDPNGWRPIDTAPKDGRDLLCWSDGLFIGAMVLYWMDGYWREKANCQGLKSDPDYWMPLPDPPQPK